MQSPGTTIDIGDHRVEVLRSPEELGDRYLLRIEAEPGGPGIKGDFPHIHPSLVETFRCIEGSMVIRLGKAVTDLHEGQRVEVPAGSVHGFLNTGTGPLIVESEVIFLGGYRPGADLLDFAVTYDRLRREGPVGRKGEPPLLQMAVLTHAYRDIIVQPGLAGALIPPLAVVGRLVGYRAEGGT